MKKIDLRSDTITRPTLGMREAMFNAEVGDDVFGEDPSINALQDYAASLFGMEAALYCTSGTQTNQIAISVHTRPGDEVICSHLAHIYLYEGGGIAQNSGASVRLLPGERGLFTLEDVKANINSRKDDHLPYTSMVAVEDTMNKGGGAIWDFEEIKRLSAFCRSEGLAFHCDGARLFNALIETGISPKEYGAQFDSISICLSKGLGAPIGSLLLGTKAFISRAHRRRKNMGGGMRQAGFAAAAGLYALQHQVERLKEDHLHAQLLKACLEQQTFVAKVLPVDTNIVIFQLANGMPAVKVVELLAQVGIACFAFGPDKIRFVTHHDVSREEIDAAIELLKGVKAD
ncbi:MAG: threonine aldolase family protein [Flavobacteriales bacterium]